MSNNIEKEIAWLFNFYLEKVDGTPFSNKIAEQLLDVIIEWAETNGYQIGGGYGKPEKEVPLFEIL